MNGIIDWMQANWFELGSLTVQFAFLSAAVWFARKILMTMRASQEQMGALLKLSLSDELTELSEPARMDTPALSSTSYAAAPPTTPTRNEAAYAAFERPARAERPSLSDELSGRREASAVMTATLDSTDSTPFVAAPLTLPEEQNGGNPFAAAGRGVVRWLQTPMASKGRSVSPWRKVVRWLQAPAGN